MRSTDVLHCRLPRDEAAAMRRLAHARGTNVSVELRRAIRAMTSPTASPVQP